MIGEGGAIGKVIILTGGPGQRLGRITSYGKDILFGPMNKVTLPIANRPNINRVIDQFGAQFPKSTAFISLGYMAYDVMATICRGRFASDIQKTFVLRDRPMSIGMALMEITKNTHRDQFGDDEYFMVIAGDTSFPGANLQLFQQKFLEYAKTHPDTLGAYGFVMRPASEFEKEHHTAVLNADGSIEKIVETPFSVEDAENISRQSSHEAVKKFHQETGQRGLPLSTAIWIFSKKIFDVVPPPDGPGRDMKYDIGKDILPKLPGRIFGYVFPEPVVDKQIVRTYTGLDCAEYFYRAQAIFIRNASELIPGVFSHRSRNWLADSTNSHGDVKDSILGNWVNVGRKCRIRNSIIGPGCRIEGGVEVVNSILTAYTHVNLIRDHGKIDRIANSVLIGNIRGGGFVDFKNMVGLKRIERSVVAPNIDGFAEASDLAITEADIENLRRVFQYGKRKR